MINKFTFYWIGLIGLILFMITASSCDEAGRWNLLEEQGDLVINDLKNTPAPIAPVLGPVKVLYMFDSSDESVTAKVLIRFKIRNDSGAAIDLEDYKVRYYYDNDGTTSELVVLEVKGGLGDDVISGSIETGYLEISFTSSNLNSGNETGEIRIRIDAGSGNYVYTNDFSRDPSKTIFEAWVQMPLYKDSILVYGVEPLL